jgi:hypothetical protein
LYHPDANLNFQNSSQMNIYQPVLDECTTREWVEVRIVQCFDPATNALVDHIDKRVCNLVTGKPWSERFRQGHPYWDRYAPLCVATTQPAKPAVRRRKKA